MISGQQQIASAVDVGSGATLMSLPLWFKDVESVFTLTVAACGLVLVLLRIYIAVQEIRRGKQPNLRDGDV
jgi:hypothetical protein